MTKVKTQARLRYLRMSPRKVRLVVDLVRGMKVREARAQLSFLSKEAAKPIAKLLESAIANALHNHDANEETLVITAAMVDGGPIMYRWTPRAMGRATPVRKRTSHVTLVLEGEARAGKKEKEAKQVEEQKEKKESKPSSRAHLVSSSMSRQAERKGRKSESKKKVNSKKNSK